MNTIVKYTRYYELFNFPNGFESVCNRILSSPSSRADCQQKITHYIIPNYNIFRMNIELCIREWILTLML